MEILQSNYPPVRTRSTSFLDMFYNLLATARGLDIAVGYVTADSLIELQQLAKLNNLAELNLTIGMHYIEHFTHAQYNAAKSLNDYLRGNRKGQVRLVTAFKYHGKIYSYSNDSGAFACIIGSNNLGSIVESSSRVYETSILIDDFEQARILDAFIKQLNRDASLNIDDCDIQQFNTNVSVLEDQYGVEKATQYELIRCLDSRTDTVFLIPVKGAEEAPKSNFNVFFGQGRKGSNGLIVPRHWYEVELIVPKDIATQPGYPNANTEEAVFNVITDDGWKFSCKVSGQNNKNLRSEGDLRILGKWLKGRLEDAGVLTIGSPVLNDTLKQYGRDTLTLTRTTLPNTWFLDFGVK